MQLEAVVCDIYSTKNGITDVNQCRYSVFYAKKGSNDDDDDDDDDDDKLYLSGI